LRFSFAFFGLDEPYRDLSSTFAFQHCGTILRRRQTRTYAKVTLSLIAALSIGWLAPGLAAALIAIRTEKATGIALNYAGLREALHSLLFWTLVIIACLVFAATSRISNRVLQVLLFWMPTIGVSLLVIVVLTLFTYAARRERADIMAAKVIVRIYRDRDSDFAQELDQKLHGFTSERHMTTSGKWIGVATVEPYRYPDELSGKVATIKPQMIILDSPNDAKLIGGMDVNLNQTTNVCGRTRTCHAFIPSWVSGDELEATKLVLPELAVDRRSESRMR
jgi:energy-converting hydrogenase Eha subunit E